MGKVRLRYVWELPVRVTHWVNVLAIVTLCVTGLYIGAPLTLTPEPSRYVMGWCRFVHLVAGFAFAVSVAARVLWSLMGNEYCRWRVFLPWLTAEGRRKMLAVFRWYVFLSRTPPTDIGLNAMAATVYSLVFLLYTLLIATGFVLYVQFAPGSALHTVSAWLTILVPLQWLRLIHHLAMWMLIGFVINHIYSAWLVDISAKGGVISGIFSGFKPEEVPEE